MVVYKETGEIEHKSFITLLISRKKDLLIIMNKVFPARYSQQRSNDAKVVFIEGIIK